MAVPHADCSDEPRARRNDCPIIAGDVYCIRESIYSAVFDILRVSNVKDAQLFSRCREAARSLVVKNHATAKRRPCIVMEDVTANVADPMSISKRREICLAASWEGTPLTDLPKLFQFFSIPIHRNRGISPDSPDHYHSLPEWDIENGFLLVWRFKTTRMLINRWPEKELGNPPTEPYVFGQKAWSKIVADCEAKEREWLRMCKEDPTFADRQARECLDHWDKWYSEREKARDATTLNTTQTGFTLNSAFTGCTHDTTKSGLSGLSALRGGTGHKVRGPDNADWRKKSHARTESQSFISLTAATNAFHEGTATRRARLSKVIKTDRSSVISAASNRFSMHRSILLPPSRRGSRDH